MSSRLPKEIVNLFEECKLPEDRGKDYRDLAVEILKTTPQALQIFENAYAAALMNMDNSGIRDYKKSYAKTCPDDLIARIVSELLEQTEYIEVDNGKVIAGDFRSIGDISPVSLEEIMSIDEKERPQLSGRYVKKDFDISTLEYLIPLFYMYLHHEKPETRRLGYHMFRQGMDLLDIDGFLYFMLDRNNNSMSKWLPQLSRGLSLVGSFLKIPRTRIVRVPMPVLQMSRIQYQSLTASTLKIIDEWAYRAFNLKDDGDYFIKTGTYSSKFDFRNARVVTPKEIRELGEYLLYIQFHASEMAGYFHGACCYGTSTTNEWVVRDFIQDAENNPKIYQGMPLHTEYRLFVDFDSREVLGVAPYWEPDLMKDRFRNHEDSDHPHMKHDYVIYKAHEDELMRRFYENKGRVALEVERCLRHMDNLQGQYSLDIMQNGDDFWAIDMAMASGSALNDYMPRNILKKDREDWLGLDIEKLPPHLLKLDISQNQKMEKENVEGR